MDSINTYSARTIEFLFALNPGISFDDFNKIRTITNLEPISERAFTDIQHKSFGLVDGVKIMLKNNLNDTKSLNKIKRFVNKNRNNPDINYDDKFNDEEKDMIANFFAINRNRKSLELPIFTWGKYVDYIGKQGFHVIEALF